MHLRLIAPLKISFLVSLGLWTFSSYADYRFTDLGILGDGVNSFGYAVSADGSVIVGDAPNGAGNSFAFEYRNGTMTNLGVLPGYTKSVAYGVSPEGSVIVGYSEKTVGVTTTQRAFKFTDNTLTDLGTLGGSSALARGASSNGQVIVGNSYITGGTTTHAFKFSNNSMTDLGTLGGLTSAANAVSPDGSKVVGSSDRSDNTRHAVLYTDDNILDLGTLGGTNSYGLGLSSDGSIITGYSRTTDNYNHAFLYQNSIMSDIGTLGGSNSFGRGISADGKVIVGHSQIAGDLNEHAFKYEDGSMTDLGTLGGANSYAYAVSADGSIIVGYSYVQAGGYTQSHAFAYLNTMLDLDNTQAALANNANQLNSVMNLQNTLMITALNYDCMLYDAKGACVKVGGSYTTLNNPNSSTAGINLVLAYHLRPEWRIGFFADSTLKNSLPENYNLKNGIPLIGLFGAWSKNSNELGPQARFSMGYRHQDVTITRSTLTNTEAGQGETAFATYGAQLEMAYGFDMKNELIIQPFIGLRTLNLTRNGYQETSGATLPVTYAEVTQSTTTAYMGSHFMKKIREPVHIQASLGLEQDLNNTMSNHSGTIAVMGAFNIPAPEETKTRLFANLEIDYLLRKNHQLSAKVAYSQQSFNNANAIIGMLTYSIGF